MGGRTNALQKHHQLDQRYMTGAELHSRGGCNTLNRSENRASLP